MRPSVVFAFPKSYNSFKPTKLLSKYFVVNIFEPFGHSLLLGVIFGKDAKFRARISAKIQVVRL